MNPFKEFSFSSAFYFCFYHSPIWVNCVWPQGKCHVRSNEKYTKMFIFIIVNSAFSITWLNMQYQHYNYVITLCVHIVLTVHDISLKGDVAALTRSSLICCENNTPNNKTMDPSPENNRAAWYQGPMKLEVVKSCGATRADLKVIVRRNCLKWRVSGGHFLYSHNRHVWSSCDTVRINITWYDHYWGLKD